MARGNIERRGKNSYRIRVYLGKGPDGKKKYHRETVRGDADTAERRRTAILHEIDTGGYVERNNITVAEHLDEWLDTWVSTDCSKTTIARYREDLKRIKKHLGHIPLQELSPPQVQAFYKKMLKSGRRDGSSLSPYTVHSFHRTLHAALEVALLWGRVGRNVCDQVKAPSLVRKVKQERKWTNAEVEKFINHIRGHRLFAMYVLCLTCGLRRGEVTGLRWQDVDLERLQIHLRQQIVVTGSKQEIVPRLKSEASESSIDISPTVRDILLEHRQAQERERAMFADQYEDHDLLFCQPNGRPLWVPNITRRQFPRLCQTAGVRRIRFHDLRHTYANYLLELGYAVTVVQRRMRHSRPSTTLDMYGHASDEAVERAAFATDRLFVNGHPSGIESRGNTGKRIRDFPEHVLERRA